MVIVTKQQKTHKRSFGRKKIINLQKKVIFVVSLRSLAEQKKIILKYDTFNRRE